MVESGRNAVYQPASGTALLMSLEGVYANPTLLHATEDEVLLGTPLRRHVRIVVRHRVRVTILRYFDVQICLAWYMAMVCTTLLDTAIAGYSYSSKRF